jgi:sugar phosphate isomerase/epimerase
MTRLSISNIAWKSEFDLFMYKYMSGNNFGGLEIAPTRIFPQNPYDNKTEAAEYAQGLISTYNICISSMQSILFGRRENIFGADEEKSALAVCTKKAIDFAAAMECKNIVFGCPGNRVMNAGQSPSDAFEFFLQIGEYAEDRQVVIALEPNPTMYGTNFINTTDEAFSFVRAVSSPGLMVNVDLGTVIYGRESLRIICDNLEFVNHIHISEPELAPVQRREIHGELSLLLKKSAYQGYVSIEMKNAGNIDLVKQSMTYVRETFE